MMRVRRAVMWDVMSPINAGCRTRAVATTAANGAFRPTATNATQTMPLSEYAKVGGSISSLPQCGPAQPQFDDWQAALRHNTTTELIRAQAALYLCSKPRLVDYGLPLLSRCVAPVVGRTAAYDASPVKWIMFDHFCGGRDLSELQHCLQRLSNASIGALLGVTAEPDAATDPPCLPALLGESAIDEDNDDDPTTSSVFDPELEAYLAAHYATAPTDAYYDDMALRVKETLRVAADYPSPVSGLSFGAVKLTGLAPPLVFARATAGLLSVRRLWRGIQRGIALQDITASDRLEECRVVDDGGDVPCVVPSRGPLERMGEISAERVHDGGAGGGVEVSASTTCVSVAQLRRWLTANLPPDIAASIDVTTLKSIAINTTGIRDDADATIEVDEEDLAVPFWAFSKAAALYVMGLDSMPCPDNAQRCREAIAASVFTDEFFRSVLPASAKLTPQETAYLKDLERRCGVFLDPFCLPTETGDDANDEKNCTASKSTSTNTKGRAPSIVASEGRHVRVLIDAEQSYYQLAIDELTWRLQARYNGPAPTANQRTLVGSQSTCSRAVPFVYNTFQASRVNMTRRVASDLLRAEREGWALGVKLVRGAYVFPERDVAAAQGYVSPVYGSKAATDASYDLCAHDLITIGQASHDIDTSSQPSSEAESSNTLRAPLPQLKGFGLLVASHNAESLGKACGLVLRDGARASTATNSKGMAPRPPLEISFAQLYGMNDHLTTALADAGHGVFKYVAYGPVDEVLAFLQRRAVENSGAMAQLGGQSQAVSWELTRRFFGTSSPR